MDLVELLENIPKEPRKSLIHMERWPSGRRQRFAKPSSGESRGIGSNPIRSAIDNKSSISYTDDKKRNLGL